MNKPAKKNILLLSPNFSPEPIGIGKYNGEMMDWLNRNGYNTTVITAFPYYPFWKIQKPYTNKWYKNEIVQYPEQDTTMDIIRCPIYVPDFPSGKKRLIQDALLWPSDFWVMLKYILFKKKQHLLITIAPPFHLAYLALFYKCLRGGKTVYHIQDLQIEAAQQLNLLNNKKLFNFLYSVEKRLLNKVDFISTISEGMQKKVSQKAGKEVLFFPNWTDTTLLFPLLNKAEIKQKWNFKSDDFICLYSGSMGGKQGLETIIFAAKKLKSIKRLKFVLAGSGPTKNDLIELSKNEGLDNVTFLPLQDKNVFNEFLNVADAHLIIQRGEASDLVMPSKLTNILAVGGVSIVTAAKGTSLYDMVYKHRVGIIAEPEDTDELVSAIERVMELNLHEMRKNARDYALKYLNIDNVMNAFLADVGLN